MELHLKWLAGLFLSLSFALVSNADTAPRFKKEKIELSYKNHKKVLTLDVARSMNEHAYGLMNRTKMAADDGMIFIFKDESIREFWMKNTLIDLDIAYISSAKVIIDIQTMKAVTSVLQTNLPTYPSKGPAQYAVEMNSGWFKKNGFPVGTTLRLLSGPTSKK
ncbi:MAG: hypothetical protein K0R29_426 [Pseudobdellovibrio sp.]|nr:hypothetical protein [Pseudobdellovibrio sp.]